MGREHGRRGRDVSWCLVPLSKQEPTFRHLLWNHQPGAQQAGVLESRSWSMRVPFWVLLVGELEGRHLVASENAGWGSAAASPVPYLEVAVPGSCGKVTASLATEETSTEVPLCPYTSTWYVIESKLRAHLSVLRRPKAAPSAREAIQQPELPSSLFPCFARCQEARRYFPTLQPFIFCSFYSG